jgi:hypothetical protein
VFPKSTFFFAKEDEANGLSEKELGGWVAGVRKMTIFADVQ